MEEPLRFTLDGSDRITLDVGGSVREQYEGYRNFELGVEDDLRGWDEYHLHRLLLHVDLRLDDRVRFFGEFGNSTIAGNERAAAPIDEDEAYLSQAFVELALDGLISDDSGVGLRLGRQEIVLGSGRLASSRDGPNIRRSFDAARLGIRRDDFSIDVFGAAEVRTRPDNFDNRP
ncbi:MAG: alginate export family protein, partial [Myxococcota bacterium]